MTFYKSDWDDRYSTVDAQEREFLAHGLPNKKGNIGIDGSALDPVLFRSSLENARTLLRATTGEETSGVLTDPASGHIHDEGFDAVMPWCQIASWVLPTSKYGGTSASVPHRYGYISDSTSYTDVLFVPFVLPLGQTKVVPCFFVKISNSNTLTIKFDFYAPGDLTTSIAGSEISVGTTSLDRVVVSDERGFDLSAISTSLSGITGHRIAYMRVRVKVSSSTAVLKEVLLRYPYNDYRQKEERTEINDSLLESDITLSQDTLKTLYVDNPNFLRKSIFGTESELPKRSYAHNHGEQRGLPLRRHQGSFAFGPYYFAESGLTTGGTVGVPLVRPNTGSFATTPKLFSSQLVFISAQISTLVCIVGGYLSGVVAPRSVTLRLELRHINGMAKEPSTEFTASNTVTLTRSGDGFVHGVCSFASIATLGQVGRDRIFELNVWQETDIASTEDYRLTGLCVLERYNGSRSNQHFIIDDPRYHATETVPVNRIKEGTEITDLLTSQWATVTNQIAKEALGGVQGFKKILSQYNTSKPWSRKIREVHQHKGTFTDTITGEIIDDGAVIRRPLLNQTYIGHVNGFGSGETDNQSDFNPVLGKYIHPTGVIDDEEWVVFESLISIPQGLGSLDLYATLNPSSTEPLSRLYCFVEVFPEGTDTNIATEISCNSLDSTDNVAGKSDNAIYCEVLPQNATPWIGNRKRLSRGLGVWSLDALKQASAVSDYIYTNAYRMTQCVQIKISPTYSGVHRFRVRWALQKGAMTLPTGGSYDNNARLLNMLLVPTRGY